MQIVYALVFRGSSTAEPNGTVFHGSSVARTGYIRCVLSEEEGVSTQLEEDVHGGQVTLSSTIIESGPTSFLESGTITFGNAENALYFATIGQGTISGEPTGTMHGAVIWRVNGGTGAFEGATGLITSNFSIVADQVTDHHWGVITLARSALPLPFLPEDPP